VVALDPKTHIATLAHRGLRATCKQRPLEALELFGGMCEEDLTRAATSPELPRNRITTLDGSRNGDLVLRAENKAPPAARKARVRYHQLSLLYLPAPIVVTDSKMSSALPQQGLEDLPLFAGPAIKKEEPPHDWSKRLVTAKPPAELINPRCLDRSVNDIKTLTSGFLGKFSFYVNSAEWPTLLMLHYIGQGRVTHPQVAAEILKKALPNNAYKEFFPQIAKQLAFELSRLKMTTPVSPAEAKIVFERIIHWSTSSVILLPDRDKRSMPKRAWSDNGLLFERAWPNHFWQGRLEASLRTVLKVDPSAPVDSIDVDEVMREAFIPSPRAAWNKVMYDKWDGVFCGFHTLEGHMRLAIQLRNRGLSYSSIEVALNVLSDHRVRGQRRTNDSGLRPYLEILEALERKSECPKKVPLGHKHLREVALSYAVRWGYGAETAAMWRQFRRHWPSFADEMVSEAQGRFG
jgi:hypothetical protein